MVTISKIVEKYIKERPYLSEALVRGVINYAGLADTMKSYVDSQFGSTVQETAIMMALRRLSETLSHSPHHEISLKTDISLKSDLFEITFHKSAASYKNIMRIYSIVDSERDFLTVTQGVYEITIFANERNHKKIRDILHGEKVIKEIRKLASLTCTLPLDAYNDPGYIFFISRTFAWENISIVEFVSTLTEMTLIVAEKDVSRSFEALKAVTAKKE